ncbi:MAG: hypothetical protein KDB23_14520, partial [Planctomycetales bacterium]|nr:hypothetical protein [Planctomycetales bacterium]
EHGESDVGVIVGWVSLRALVVVGALNARLAIADVYNNQAEILSEGRGTLADSCALESRNPTGSVSAPTANR